MINQKIIKKNFLYYDFDDKYLALDITDKTTIYQTKTRTALLRRLAHFDPVKEHQGLYLYGSSTKGKTYIFMAYAVYLAKKYSQMKIAFVNTAHLINTVRQEQNQRSATSRPLLLDILKTADILFIDDLGVSK